MLSGLILDGGPSQRMDGEWKALLPFGGETMIERQVKEMSKICAEVIVVTPDPKPFLRLLDIDVRIITDFYPGKGPLGGMHAGFNLAKHPHIWVIGSHMPFPSSEAAELLFMRKKDGFDAAVPYLKGGIYPLHGVYDKRCADDVLKLIQRSEMRLSALMNELLWFEVAESIFAERGIDTRFITGIHTRDDYSQALNCMRGSLAG
ncbi:hypothetical protein SD70_06100 [Gordoniibacillus kamchatkensis]|uniref:MobA-like NTP transferase domain-containing protein n=1 Tax=Gordoniibacillus kamchatkensis TaxID=1590651 RepID=A0ABR5AL12_9BACL|nr:molybdenum cofactor guanylyltransferase [Paenibacillus sp. VKM B-2647]KIL41679.1 hypothetical protein SD70_06100 [Paenibacillus sp. VKM B-2647]